MAGDIFRRQSLHVAGGDGLDAIELRQGLLAHSRLTGHGRQLLDPEVVGLELLALAFDQRLLGARELVSADRLGGKVLELVLEERVEGREVRLRRVNRCGEVTFTLYLLRT